MVFEGPSRTWSPGNESLPPPPEPDAPPPVAKPVAVRGSGARLREGMELRPGRGGRRYWQLPLVKVHEIETLIRAGVRDCDIVRALGLTSVSVGTVRRAMLAASPAPAPALAESEPPPESESGPEPESVLATAAALSPAPAPKPEPPRMFVIDWQRRMQGWAFEDHFTPPRPRRRTKVLAPCQAREALGGRSNSSGGVGPVTAAVINPRHPPKPGFSAIDCAAPSRPADPFLA
jgi:hypothetical protein